MTDIAASGIPATVFFDVDGTLISHGSGDIADTVENARPTDAVYEAFRRLRARGHRAFICTGRPLCLVPQALHDLHPNGMITGAGACVSQGTRVLQETSIPHPLLEETVRRLASVGATVLFEGSQGCVTLTVPGNDQQGFPGVPIARTAAEALAAMGDAPFDKFSYYDTELPRLARIAGFLNEHFVNSNLGIGAGEYSQVGINKGAGVRHALESLGLGRERTFAFGDSENDLAMLAAVETPIAMGNALPSVKAAAAHVTDSVDRDGVVSGLEHFGLI